MGFARGKQEMPRGAEEKNKPLRVVQKYTALSVDKKNRKGISSVYIYTLEKNYG